MTDAALNPSAPGLNGPDQAQIDDMIASVLARVDRALPSFIDRFPAPSSENGFYRAIDNVEWTNGFWTGMLWLSWEVTGEHKFRAAAETQVASFAERLARRINLDHHDLGFLYTLSACAAHQLTGSGEGRAAGIGAARLLLDRFDPVAGVIQAWGDMADPEQRGRMIIDCNLNLPLLYWGARETGEKVFREAADRHLAEAARFLVRPDGSTFHTFYVDTETGAPRYGSTHQGYSDDSCWARGQAWGIYGFALGFRHTKDPALLKLSVRLADYFLARLPSDGVCAWDLVFTDDDAQRDSSAAAIAACGLLELAGALPDTDPSRARYRRWAWTILRALHESYLAPLEASNGVLAHGVYHMPHRVGVDECCVWGDYFYLETLVRLSRDWDPYW